ncbi:MAG: substrate-binding domain-containing protein [Anaerolineae bacterium]
MQTSASAYERHQEIVDIINRVKSVRVAELAEQLNVSESTIRTDLETLDDEGRLVRVRGGAIAIPSEQQTLPVPIARKALQNADEKQAIARWSAGLVEDGDVIMLDASSTVYHIARFLHDRRDLTVFTNGISVAQELAKEPTNTVIIIGGILRPNGNAITGEISKQLLQDYHVRTVFVSCSAFKPDLGFFEMDMQEAQMKSLLLQSAQRRVALLDSSKIGEVGLTAFASLDEFDYFVTDEGISADMIQTICQRDTHVIVCGEKTIQSHTPSKGVHSKKLRIGFANLSENTPFSRDVRRSLEEATHASGQIELILADNQLDPQVAIQVADELIAQKPDLVIEYQIDETIGNLIAHKFQQAQIPVIAVDIPMVGATYFGVNNYQAGQMAGMKLGKAIQSRWQGAVDYVIVLEQQRAGSLPAMRIQGQVDGLIKVIGDVLHDKIIAVDSDNTSEGSYQAMQSVFSQIEPDANIALICFNDDAAVGALYAARDAHFEQQLLLVGQGADRRLRTEMRARNSPVVGATAYRPEEYGKYLIQLALDIINGKQVPPAVYMKHDFITPDNVDTFYEQDHHTKS